MAIETNDPIKALVAFGNGNVGLYLFPAAEKVTYTKRFLVLEMPRDNSKRDDDQNVQYVRRLADAINDAGLINPTTGTFLAVGQVPA